MLAALEAILGELGTRLLEWRARGETSGEWVGSQLKAEADRRAHEFLVDALAKRWPGIPVISEEDVDSQGDRRPQEYWLIDPIDGTASFCGGYPGFVTQAALLRGGRPEIGVVHAPALRQTWTAERGQAAFCDGKRIHVAATKDEKVLIDNYPEPRGLAADLFRDLRFTKYVESGSIGLKLCRVADGTAHVFAKDIVVRDWDLAPADIILVEAGGRLATFQGEEVRYEGSWEKAGIVAASSARLLDEIDEWRTRR